MRSPWIALEGPKSSCQCSYKRQRRGCAHTGGEGHMQTGARMSHKTKAAWSPQKSRKRRKKRDSPLETSEAAWPCRHLDSRAERIKFCCFKPPNLWESVIPQIWEEPGTSRVGLYCVGTPSCHQSQQVNTFLGKQGRVMWGMKDHRKKGASPAWAGSTHPGVSVVRESRLHLVILLC